MQRIELAGLTTRIVGSDDATRTVVLLHGFGAPGDDLVALAQFIKAPQTRFVFPAEDRWLPGVHTPPHGIPQPASDRSLASAS